MLGGQYVDWELLFFWFWSLDGGELVLVLGVWVKKEVMYRW